MESTYYGIDVSRWQGTIDWEAVKASGVKFAFIRLGWCGYDGGIVSNGGVDSMFDANMNGAAAAGIDVGIYLYSYAKTADAAQKAARETIGLIGDYTVSYPVVFDMEDSMYQTYGKTLNTQIAGAYLAEVERLGYYSMLYSFKSFVDSYLDMSSLTRYDFWLAQWASAATYSGSYGIWQYSNTGTVDGIGASVDLNTAYKDYPSLIARAGLNNLGGGTDVDDTGSGEATGSGEDTGGSDGGDTGSGEDTGGSDGGDTGSGEETGGSGGEEENTGSADAWAKLKDAVGMIADLFRQQGR